MEDIGNGKGFLYSLDQRVLGVDEDIVVIKDIDLTGPISDLRDRFNLLIALDSVENDSEASAFPDGLMELAVMSEALRAIAIEVTVARSTPVQPSDFEPKL